MRVLVVGGGPIGRRHVRNLLLLGHEPALARRRGGDVQALQAELGVPVFAGLDAATAWEPQAVVVANAPADHLETALWASRRGCSVLVEKPLAPGPDGVDELLGADVHVAVGHNLRFHPGLQAVAAAVAGGRIGALLAVRAEVGSHLPAWHPERDYRASSAASAALGGGALLTLVHELDYVLWIAGDGELAGGVATKVSGLEVDADDVAELLLVHRSGAVSSIHMDLLDRSYNRRSRWVGEEGTIEWRWGGPVRLGADTVLWEDDRFDLNETYVAELRAFLSREPAPGDALADARRGLELIAAVRRS